MGNDSKQHVPSFTEEERASIIEYANVLRSIHNQLAGEGYLLPGGRVWNVFKCASPIVEIEMEADN